MTFLVQRDDQIVKLKLKDKVGGEIALHAAATDMYTAINKLGHQLDKFLRRRKDRRLRNRTRDKMDPFAEYDLLAEGQEQIA